MKVLRAIKSEFLRSFDLRGRTTRADYLWFLATSIALFATSSTLILKLLPASQTTVAMIALTLAFYLPVTSAGVRRLHDVGESGVHMLNPLKPALMFGILLTLAVSNLGGAIVLASFLGFAGVILILFWCAAAICAFMTATYFSHTFGLLLLPSQAGQSCGRASANGHPI